MNPNGSITKEQFNTSLNISEDFLPSEYTLLWIMLRPDQVLTVPKNLNSLVGDARVFAPALADQYSVCETQPQAWNAVQIHPGVPYNGLDSSAAHSACLLVLPPHCACRLPKAPFLSSGGISGLQRFLVNFSFF